VTSNAAGDAGNFHRQAGYLVLEQYLGALAAVTMFAMADLDEVLGRHDGPGYCAAQLEAGIRVGRVYLGASRAASARPPRPSTTTT
jgi:hypothetical protein